MKVVIYVNWREEKVISKSEYERMIEETTEEYFESHADFCDWLNEHYEANAIWFMNAKERERINEEEYREACQTWAEDEVNDYWKPYEIEV